MQAAARTRRMPAWSLWFDGLYEPRHSRRGVATYGFVVEHGEERVHEGSGFVAGPGPPASADVAEFAALVQALEWLRDHGGASGCPVVVRGDSRLVVETTAGRWKLRSERLLPLRDLAARLAREVGVERFEKVPRERNADADRLSREAYREATGAHPEWGLGRHARAAR